MNSRDTEKGAVQADKKYKIIISEKGPYLVYGAPLLSQKFIVPKGHRKEMEYINGKRYMIDKEPTALCRCGSSSNKPYCDGTHMRVEWDYLLTADTEPILSEAIIYNGSGIAITDNERYCAFARFCDADGGVWNMLESAEGKENNEKVIDITNKCPGDRLKAWDTETDSSIETSYSAEIIALEDQELQVIGPLWVRGGITLDTSNGTRYELRNKMTLCRCGRSSNKPYCDGTHAQK